jgi:L-ascorbate metabolism protein UlaG (beta-lactamase superfamily)
MHRLAITWLGHSTFIVRTPGGRRVLFDPWLTGNPACPEALRKPPKVDVILASHGHSDHTGDLVACARESRAPVVAIWELCDSVFVVTLEDGRSLYYAGDTCLFGDMRLIGEIYRPEIAFLPIGDRFTMDPAAAARACEMLGVRQVVPMHWGTFPLLTGTPAALKALVEPRGVHVLELEPGQTAE